MTTILAIDTSSESGSAAIRAQGRTRGEVRLEGSMHYSDRLFSAIEEVIDSAGVTLDSIEVFAAARGPGSFTGLRVGLAAVEGLAFAQGRTAVGVSTLAALAWQIAPTGELIAPVLDARRSEIYGSLFRRTPEELVEVRRPVVLQPGHWLDSLPNGGIVFCGSGADAHRSLIGRRPGSRCVSSDPYLAATIAELTDAGYREALEPLYVRPSNAKMSSSR